jgi:hypothetical protein
MEPGGYGVENRIQVNAIIDPARGRELLGAQAAEEAAAKKAAAAKAAAAKAAADKAAADRAAAGPGTAPASPPGPPPTVVDAARPRGADFWGRAAAGDRALTRLMVAGTDDDRTAAATELVDHYTDAFRRRSTYSERSSSIDHLCDLRDLLPDGDPRHGVLDGAIAAFEEWKSFDAPDERPAAVARPAADRPTSDDQAPAGDPQPRAAASVTLTAMPAACGDCLLLDYSGDDGPHRILVDGGLGSAYERGLGTLLDPAGSPTRVDIAVVTHIDLDHIEGVLRALKDRRLVADDFWFNGRDQLVEHITPGPTRGVLQGDALSALIPDGTRNLAASGGVFVVPDAGDLPVFVLPGGATATLLSPSEDRLRRLLKKWPTPTRGETGSVEELLAAFEDDGADRGPGQFGRDSSVANGSSIAFLFEHDGASILLTGDGFAKELETSIRRLIAQRGLPKLPVQLFKLAHHGSRQNMTDELLSLIEPEQILICTDGTKFAHPDEDALAKVLAHYPNAQIHFTDDTELIRARAAQAHGQVPLSLPQVITL